MTTSQTKNETKVRGITTTAIAPYPGLAPWFVRTVDGSTVLVTSGLKARTEVYRRTRTGLEIFRGYADEIDTVRIELALALHERARRTTVRAA